MVRGSLFIVHCSLFIVDGFDQGSAESLTVEVSAEPFIAGALVEYPTSNPLTINYQPLTTHHEPSTTHHEPSTIHHELPTIHHEPPTTHHEPPTIRHEPSTMNHSP